MSPLSVTLLAPTQAHPDEMFSVSLLPVVKVELSDDSPAVKSLLNPADRKFVGSGSRLATVPLAATVKMLLVPAGVVPQSGGADAGASRTSPSNSNPVVTLAYAGLDTPITPMIASVLTTITANPRRIRPRA